MLRVIELLDLFLLFWRRILREMNVYNYFWSQFIKECELERKTNEEKKQLEKLDVKGSENGLKVDIRYKPIHFRANEKVLRLHNEMNILPINEHTEIIGK